MPCSLLQCKDEAVVVKIQFPNIRQSVESDIGYLKVFLTAGQLLPKGLFLDKTIAVCTFFFQDCSQASLLIRLNV